MSRELPFAETFHDLGSDVIHADPGNEDRTEK
jgi:hypothetical protein